jgi:hypothetical protein
MYSKQTFSAVYGLFHKTRWAGPTLLGIYFLKGEAKAARQALIEEQIKNIEQPVHQDYWRKEFKKSVLVRRLAVGRIPPIDLFDHAN